MQKMLHRICAHVFSEQNVVLVSDEREVGEVLRLLPACVEVPSLRPVLRSVEPTVGYSKRELSQRRLRCYRLDCFLHPAHIHTIQEFVCDWHCLPPER